MSEHVVIEHVHDEAAGVYRLVIGRPIIATNAEGESADVVGYEDVRDIVWADDDERWHTRVGASRRRRPADEVAAQQRELAAAALSAEPPDGSGDPPPVEMPGAGEQLPAVG